MAKKQTPAQRLADIARQQKENTRPFIDNLKAEGDPQAEDMIKIKKKWDLAKKTRRIALWKFALEQDEA